MFSLPRNVWILTLILAFAMSAGAMMIMVGGLVGTKLAPSQGLATLPVAMMIIGTAAGVLPVTRAMGKLGRKLVFLTVALLACFACLLAALSIYIAHFKLFLLATFLLGVAISGFQQIRFAAMESVALELAPKAASTVLLGGLAAAIIGPELATFGNQLLPIAYVGSFVLMGVLCLLCFGLFCLFTETHKPIPKAQRQKVDISDVLCKPSFIIAVSASVVGYALMSFIMTATPVHMHVNTHHSLEQAKWVIQSHILAMYLPSIFSGVLIAKLGVYRVIWAGLFIYLLTIIAGSIDSHLINYWSALILLGIGWNFLFLGGTVLLPQSHTANQKFQVQSVNEFAVFSAQGLASLGAGALLFALGWQGLMLTSFIIICCQIILLSWQVWRIKAASTSQLTEEG
ncbi:MFS transporter [Aliiglaciecola sp. 3_MG-2023]|uniref:MFS transporter n=1 Tax=Aliiglaciecola sp. 3_MG-2023 TaxID=3062644 RepID=UPI0026E32F43|nr:MFS transporter [Aliiglaciecola sp. 3_MG-2023]MDO6692190.1 MFS transporter [Aliiglaciecola sp. 3_MG-2023]